MVDGTALETRLAVLEARFDDVLKRVDASTVKMDQLIEQLGLLNNKFATVSVYYKVLFPTVTILVGIIGWFAGVKLF